MTSNPKGGGQGPRMLRITYSTSAIGVEQDQKATVRRLGLRRLGQTIDRPDTPALRGMIHKVRHLVSVRELATEEVENEA